MMQGVDWLIVGLAAIIAILTILLERQRRKWARRLSDLTGTCVRALDQMRANHTTDLAMVERGRDEQCRALRETIEDMQASHNSELARIIKTHMQISEARDHRFNLETLHRNGLIHGAVPAVVRLARVRFGEREGDRCARWLYVAHCLGVWNPNHEDGRILARGQFLEGRNPLQLDEMLEKLAERELPPMTNDEARMTNEARSPKPEGPAEVAPVPGMPPQEGSQNGDAREARTIDAVPQGPGARG